MARLKTPGQFKLRIDCGYQLLTVGVSRIVNPLGYYYAYDRFGNRWQQNYTQGPGAPSSVSFSFDGDNRISTEGYIYDAAGNLVMDNLNCYT